MKDVNMEPSPESKRMIMELVAHLTREMVSQNRNLENLVINIDAMVCLRSHVGGLTVIISGKEMEKPEKAESKEPSDEAKKEAARLLSELKKRQEP